MTLDEWRLWVHRLVDDGGLKEGEMLIVQGGTPQIVSDDRESSAPKMVGPAPGLTTIKGWLIDNGYWPNSTESSVP